MAKQKQLSGNEKQQVRALVQNNQLQQAATLCRQVCRQYKNDAEAWFMLGAINGAMGLFQEAETCCRRVLQIRPDFAEAHLNLGNALNKQGAKKAAAESFRQALNCQPDYANAYHALGNVLRDLMEHQQAAECFEQVLRITPRNAAAYVDLGNTRKAQGRIKDAISCFQQALIINPDYEQAHVNIIACMNYDHTVSAKAVSQAHLDWGRQLRQKAGTPVPHSNRPDPGRRLRVGYVSPDLRAHSVTFFFTPLLANHDAAQVETICYTDVRVPDATTERLRSLAGAWRYTRGISDARLDAMIREDAIDILIDLAGHTQDSRLGVFARKPAPVQVSYLGYPNTTGLRAVDYRLTDVWADPSGLTDAYYAETLVRLPDGFLCYEPPPEAPPVAPLAAKKAGNITFGSFNNLAKCTTDVIRLWASILQTVPGSRLILKSHWLADASTRRRYFDLFSEGGIARDRVEMFAWLESIEEHLSLYDRVDIALDTFPYNGTATTCEAMWMGVPVVTLAGTVHACRVGASLLNQVGLMELIANSEAEYIAVAAALAGDLERLSRLRTGLRARVAASSLGDPLGFARRVEACYREMWKKWCASKS